MKKVLSIALALALLLGCNKGGGASSHVEETTHEEICADCGGTGISGTKTCLNCNGRGATKCVACGGDGKCDWCFGRGYAVISGDACRYCNGTGKCKSCGGSGTKGTCTRCGGSGEENVTCSTCGGTGKITVNGPAGGNESSSGSEGTYTDLITVDAWAIYALSNGSYSLTTDKIKIVLRNSDGKMYVKDGTTYNRVYSNSDRSFGGYDVSPFSYTATKVVSLGNSIHWYFSL